MVQVTISDKCVQETEIVPERKKPVALADFDPERVLHPHRAAGGYIPESWQGASCNNARLVTKGFVKDEMGFALLIEDTGRYSTWSTDPILSFQVPRQLPGIRFRDSGPYYMERREQANDPDWDRVAVYYRNHGKATNPPQKEQKRKEQYTYLVPANGLPIQPGDTIKTDGKCRADLRENASLTLQCDAPPKEKKVSITGTRQGGFNHPAYTALLDVSDSQRPPLVSTTLYFYLQALVLDDNSRLRPDGLRVNAAQPWSPCKKQESGEVYRCAIEVDAGQSTPPKAYRLRLKRGPDTAETTVTPDPGALLTLPGLFEGAELPLDYRPPPGHTADSWQLSSYADPECTKQILLGTGDIVPNTARWARLYLRSNHKRFSECLPLPGKTSDLNIREGKLTRYIRFSEARSIVALPDDIPWQSGHTLHWTELRKTPCRVAPRTPGAVKDTPPKLNCKDVRYSDKAQWPRFTIRNSEGRQVLAAALDLSDLSKSRLSGPEYSLYLRGPAHLSPAIDDKQPCKRTGSGAFHCRLRELKVQKLHVRDDDNQTATLPVSPPRLESGGRYDWIDWLREQSLPLTWTGEGDFSVRFPANYWRGLRLYNRSGCGDNKTESSDEQPKIYSLERLSSDGLGKVQARLEGSLRLVGPESARQTECASLTGNNLRIEDGKLKIGFHLQPVGGKTEPNGRTLLIVDVSDRMAQYTEKLLPILREYDPPANHPITLGLMGSALHVRAYSEDFDPAAFQADVKRLLFNHHPDDLLNFMALALESVRGTGHRLRVFLSPRWTERFADAEYPPRSIGYLKQTLEIRGIQGPVDLYLLAGKQSDCDSLEASLSKNGLASTFRCRPLAMKKLPKMLRTP